MANKRSEIAKPEPPARERRHDPESVREAALTLFSDYGYQKTTMNDIANALGIRAPSLYNHLSSKDELLEDMMFDSVKEMQASYNGATKGIEDPVKRLALGFESHVRYHMWRRREAFIVNREMRSLKPATRKRVLKLRDAYEAEFRLTIEAGMEADLFHVESSILAANAILAMGRGVATWYRSDVVFNEDQIAVQFVDFALRLLGAVAPPPA